MGKRIEYLCKSCGKKHVGLPDVSFHAPDHYANATPEEQQANFVLTSDTCVMKDGDEMHYFVRGVLLVPILATKERFGWGVWTTLSERNYERYLTLSDRAVATEPAYFGWFANNISEYPRTRGLKAKVRLQPRNQRPLITLEPTDHPLAQEQHHGITIERAIELAGPYLHQT